MNVNEMLKQSSWHGGQLLAFSGLDGLTDFHNGLTGRTSFSSPGIELFVKRGLLNRPIIKGDTVVIPGIALMGGQLPFMVANSAPKGIVQITEDTKITVKEEPVSIDRIIATIENGSLTEAFGVGTAASIAPVGELL